MRHQRHELGFLPKPLEHSRIRTGFLVEEFDGDAFAELQMFCFIDVSAGACPEEPDDPILAADGLTHPPCAELRNRLQDGPVVATELDPRICKASTTEWAVGFGRV